MRPKFRNKIPNHLLKNGLIVFLLCLHALPVFCQFPEAPKSLLSPNSNGISAPVSMYAGLPQITVPIYTLNEGPIKVPIYLSYNAGGVKTEMHPGWTGLNWSLVSGGAITRKIRDFNDDWFLVENYPNTVGLYNNNIDLNGFNNNPLTDKDLSHDTETDEYSFNFLGISGKFYLDYDFGNHPWRVQSTSNVKVELFYSATDGEFLYIPFNPPTSSSFHFKYGSYGYGGSFTGFVITTEDGTKYTFGGVTDAIEYSIPFFNQNNSIITADTWYLTKIQTVYGKEVNLSYSRGNLINQLYTSMTYFSKEGDTPPATVVPEYGAYQGQLIFPVYLNSITGSYESVNFNRSSTTEMTFNQSLYDPYYKYWKSHNDKMGKQFLPFLNTGNVDGYPDNLNKLVWHKLDNITVQDIRNVNKLSFDLNYNNNADERLMLLSLTKKDKNGIAIPPYQFQYFPYNQPSDGVDDTKLLPNYLMRNIDHWGFNNKYDFHDYEINYAGDSYDFTRATHSEYLYAGTLQKIISPTGGTTEYFYEPHSYGMRVQIDPWNPLSPYLGSSNPDNSNIVGGLRIKQILNYNSPNDINKLSKEYLYVSGYTPSAPISSLTNSGILKSTPKYRYDQLDGVCKFTYIGMQSIQPMGDYISGNPVGYSEVVEKEQNGGYTIYKFTNIGNDFGDGNSFWDLPGETTGNFYSFFQPFTEREFLRGNPYEITIYNKLGNPLKKDLISYKPLSATYVAANKISSFKDFCPSITSLWNAIYKHPTYKFSPIKKETYLYNIDDKTKSLYNSVIYTYNNNSKVNDILTIESNGNQVGKHISYASDFPQTQDALGDKLIVYNLQKRNMDPPLETYSYKTLNGINYVINANYTSFRTNPMNYDQIVPYQSFSLATNSPLKINTSAFQPTDQFTPLRFLKNQGQDPHYIPTNTIQRFDNFGNVVETSITSDVNHKELHKYYFYDAKQTLPIAEISNQALHSFPEKKTIPVFKGPTLPDDQPLDLTRGDTNITEISRFSLDHDQTFTFQYDVMDLFSLNPGSVTVFGIGYTLNIYDLYMNLKWSTNITQFAKASGFLTSFTNSVDISLPAGTYIISSSSTTTYYANDDPEQLEYFYLYSVQAQLLTTYFQDDVFYTSFEDGQEGVSLFPVSKTGLNSCAGAFNIPSHQGVYNLSYWSKLGNTDWTLIKQKVNGGSSLIIGLDGQLIDEVRLYPDGVKMSTVNYNTNNQTTSETNSNYQTTNYEYDALGRISVVLDQNKNILKMFCYNFAGQLEDCQGKIFYSDAQSINFTRNNCTGIYTGNTVPLSLPDKAYKSTISKADANQQALNYINANGQSNANLLGICGISYSSVAKSQSYTRNNCICGLTGASVTYNVLAGTYVSFVSQADADAKAQTDINSNGQAYANANGNCTNTCTQQNQKVINCNCETNNGQPILLFQTNTGSNCILHYGFRFSDGSYTELYPNPGSCQ